MIEPSVGVNPVMPGWPGFVSAFPYGLLTQDVAPTSEPLTLAQAKKHLRLPMEQTDEDDVIETLISVASGMVERITERALLQQTWSLYLDSFPWWRSPILVPKPPCLSVVSVQYYDADQTLQTWATSNYHVVAPEGPTAQRAQIVPAAGVSYPLLPSFALTQRRPDAVRVQFQAGWPDVASVPKPMIQAMKLLIGHLFERREVLTSDRVMAMPMGVEALLAPYRMLAY